MTRPEKGVPTVDGDPARLPEIGRAAAAAGARIEEVHELAVGCRGCDLWRRATQTVFGAGPPGATTSAVLRARDASSRQALLDRLASDLRLVA